MTSVITFTKSDLITLLKSEEPRIFASTETVRIADVDKRSCEIITLRRAERETDPVLAALMHVHTVIQSNPDAVAHFRGIERAQEAEEDERIHSYFLDIFNKILLFEGISLQKVSTEGEFSFDPTTINSITCVDITSTKPFYFKVLSDEIHINIEDMFEELRKVNTDTFVLKRGQILKLSDRRGVFGFYSDDFEDKHTDDNFRVPHEKLCAEIETVFTKANRETDPNKNDIVVITGEYYFHYRKFAFTMLAKTDVKFSVEDHGVAGKKRSQQVYLDAVHASIARIRR